MALTLSRCACARLHVRALLSEVKYSSRSRFSSLITVCTMWIGRPNSSQDMTRRRDFSPPVPTFALRSQECVCGGEGGGDRQTEKEREIERVLANNCPRDTALNNNDKDRLSVPHYTVNNN